MERRYLPDVGSDVTCQTRGVTLPARRGERRYLPDAWRDVTCQTWGMTSPARRGDRETLPARHRDVTCQTWGRYLPDAGRDVTCQTRTQAGLFGLVVLLTDEGRDGANGLVLVAGQAVTSHGCVVEAPGQLVHLSANQAAQQRLVV